MPADHPPAVAVGAFVLRRLPVLSVRRGELRRSPEGGRQQQQPDEDIHEEVVQGEVSGRGEDAEGSHPRAEASQVGGTQETEEAATHGLGAATPAHQLNGGGPVG